MTFIDFSITFLFSLIYFQGISEPLEDLSATAVDHDTVRLSWKRVQLMQDLQNFKTENIEMVTRVVKTFQNTSSSVVCSFYLQTFFFSFSQQVFPIFPIDICPWRLTILFSIFVLYQLLINEVGVNPSPPSTHRVTQNKFSVITGLTKTTSNASPLLDYFSSFL